jgi:hypothetical protein
MILIFLSPQFLLQVATVIPRPRLQKNLVMPLTTQTDFLSITWNKYILSIPQLTHLIYDGENGKRIKYMYNNDEMRLQMMYWTDTLQVTET